MKPHRLRRRIPLFIFILILLTIGVLLYDSNTRIVTTEYELRYADLPASFDGFRIVVLSDIHAAEFGKNNDKLVTKVRDANADIIIISGDVIDHDDKPPLERQLEIAETLVESLTPIAPVYYITGNHEWDSGGIWQLLGMLEEREVNILRNRYVLLQAGGDAIILAGTDDPNGPADMIRADEFLRKTHESEGGLFTIVLEHRNNRLPLYSELDVNLVISGHAHGGIIRLPFTDGLIGPSRDWLPTYTNGVYSLGNTDMVVSRGIGNHTGWPRFLNNPQIVVVNLASGD